MSTDDEPGVATLAPQSAEITTYDEPTFVTYLRLLDASAAGASEGEMCKLILGIDLPRSPNAQALPPRVILPYRFFGKPHTC